MWCDGAEIRRSDSASLRCFCRLSRGARRRPVRASAVPARDGPHPHAACCVVRHQHPRQRMRWWSGEALRGCSPRTCFWRRTTSTSSRCTSCVATPDAKTRLPHASTALGSARGGGSPFRYASASAPGGPVHEEPVNWQLGRERADDLWRGARHRRWKGCGRQ